MIYNKRTFNHLKLSYRRLWNLLNNSSATEIYFKPGILYSLKMVH